MARWLFLIFLCESLYATRESTIELLKKEQTEHSYACKQALAIVYLSGIATYLTLADYLKETNYAKEPPVVKLQFLGSSFIFGAGAATYHYAQSRARAYQIKALMS